MLDVRRLRVLKAVVETGSVTAAAKRLNYTASAVSQHISSLEREAGVALLERWGRGVRPTAAGNLLAQHTGDILERLGEAERALTSLRNGESGRFALVAFPTAGAGLVPAAVGEFRDRCPGVELDLRVAETEPATEMVRRGEVDLAVALENFDDRHLPADGLTRHHLLDDPFRIVLPKAHPFAGRRTIELGELAADPWVAATCSLGSCERTALDACVAAGFTPHFAVEADDYPAAQGYVAVGLGVAMIPLLALGAVRDDVVVRRIKGAEPIRHIYAITRAAAEGPPAVMLQALANAAAEQRRAQAAPR